MTDRFDYTNGSKSIFGSFRIYPVQRCEALPDEMLGLQTALGQDWHPIRFCRLGGA
jgi:hypothetical protein